MNDKYTYAIAAVKKGSRWVAIRDNRILDSYNTKKEALEAAKRTMDLGAEFVEYNPNLAFCKKTHLVWDKETMQSEIVYTDISGKIAA